MKTRLTILFVLLFAAVLGAACGPAAATDGEVTSVLTEAEAVEIAENALAGFNTGDYALWSRDWDDVLKGAISEDAFLEYREQALDITGQYQSILSVEMTPSPQEGSVRWVFTCQFEKVTANFILAFDEDSRLAHTVLIEPVE